MEGLGETTGALSCSQEQRLPNRCRMSRVCDCGDEGLPLGETKVARVERVFVLLLGIEVVDASA